MTRDEAKELLPIIKAFSEGKVVQSQLGVGQDWQDSESPTFSYAPKYYRIKPEPKYRPFKDAEECWQEMQKHQPVGWVKDNAYYVFISFVGCATIAFNSSANKTYEEIIELLTFADGTPFGVKEEE